MKKRIHDEEALVRRTEFAVVELDDELLMDVLGTAPQIICNANCSGATCNSGNCVAGCGG